MKKKPKKKNGPVVQIPLGAEEEALFQAALGEVQKSAKAATRASMARAAMWIGLPKIVRSPGLIATAQAPHFCPDKAGTIVGHDEACPHNR